MKKIYEQPIIEITIFNNEDIITTSSITTTSYDPFNLTGKNGDQWF